MYKRKYHRLLLETDILYKDVVDQKTQNSRTKNISIGGICVTTIEQPLEVNKLYQLQFKMPGKQTTIEATGRVTWNKSFNLTEETLFDNGIEFINLQQKYITLIEEYSIGYLEI